MLLILIRNYNYNLIDFEKNFQLFESVYYKNRIVPPIKKRDFENAYSDLLTEQPFEELTNDLAKKLLDLILKNPQTGKIIEFHTTQFPNRL